MGKNTRTFAKDFRDAKASRSLKKPKDIDYTSKMGYQDGSPFSNRPYIDINTPNGMIDMSNTGRPIMANGQYLPPYSGMYDMGSPVVREIPLAQNGLNTPEAWEKEIRSVEHRIGDPSGWTLENYNELQNKLNEYKAWRENTPEGRAVIDYHNEPNEYVIPLPSHLKGIPKQMYGGDPSLPNITGHYPFGGQYTKTHTHFKTGGWLDNIPKAQGDKPTSIVKEEKIIPYSKRFIYRPEDIANAGLQERAAGCHKGECLEGANTYYNKYVAPIFSMPDTWRTNEAYGIMSGNENMPYGVSADSWDLAAELQAKGAIQNYAAPLYDENKVRNYEREAEINWNKLTPEEKQKIYSGMALGTLVNYGDYGSGSEYRRSGSNEKAGLYPSRHSARVVGYAEDRMPLVYDWGKIRRLDESGLGHPITNITTPKEYAKYNYDYVKSWQDKNAGYEYNPNEKLFLLGKNTRADESAIEDDELKFVEGINKNIKRFMEITGAPQEDIIKAGKVAFGIMQGETRGGRGSLKAKAKELAKSYLKYQFDPLGVLTSEPSKGYTRMKKEMLAGDETNRYSQYLKDLGYDPKKMDLWDPETAAVATTALILSRKGDVDGVDKWYLRAQQHNQPSFGEKKLDYLKRGDADYATNVINNTSRLFSPKTGYGIPETQKWLSEKQKIIAADKQRLEQIKNTEIKRKLDDTVTEDYTPIPIRVDLPSESTNVNIKNKYMVKQKKYGGWLDNLRTYAPGGNTAGDPPVKNVMPADLGVTGDPRFKLVRPEDLKSNQVVFDVNPFTGQAQQKDYVNLDEISISPKGPRIDPSLIPAQARAAMDAYNQGPRPEIKASAPEQGYMRRTWDAVSHPFAAFQEAFAPKSNSAGRFSSDWLRNQQLEKGRNLMDLAVYGAAAAPALEAAGAYAAPYIGSALNAPFTYGSTTLPWLTANKAMLATGLAHSADQMIDPNSQLYSSIGEAYKNPNKQTLFDAAGNVVSTGLGFIGPEYRAAKSAFLDDATRAGQIISEGAQNLGKRVNQFMESPNSLRNRLTRNLPNFQPQQLRRLEPPPQNLFSSDEVWQQFRNRMDQMNLDARERLRQINQLPPPPAEITIPDLVNNPPTPTVTTWGSSGPSVTVNPLSGNDISYINNASDFDTVLERWARQNNLSTGEGIDDATFLNRLQNTYGNRHGVNFTDQSAPNYIGNITGDTKAAVLRDIASNLHTTFTPQELTNMRNAANRATAAASQTPTPSYRTSVSPETINTIKEAKVGDQKAIDDVVNILSTPKESTGFVPYNNVQGEVPKLLNHEKHLLTNKQIDEQLKSFEQVYSDLKKSLDQVNSIPNPNFSEIIKYEEALNKVKNNLEDLRSTKFLRENWVQELKGEGLKPDENLSIFTDGYGRKNLVNGDGEIIGSMSIMNNEVGAAGVNYKFHPHSFERSGLNKEESLKKLTERLGSKEEAENMLKQIEKNNNNRYGEALYRGINNGIKDTRGNLFTSQHFAYTQLPNKITGTPEELQRAKAFWESKIRKGKAVINPAGKWEMIKKHGGDIDYHMPYFNKEVMYAMMTGGTHKKKLKKDSTSKNIKSSINKLMARNEDMFGPKGKAYFDPDVKPYYKTGGWLDHVK